MPCDIGGWRHSCAVIPPTYTLVQPEVQRKRGFPHMIDLHRAYGLSFIEDDSSADVITFAAETWLVAKAKDQGG